MDTGNDSRQVAPSPPVLICPPPLLGHHPIVTSLLERSKVIIRLMKEGKGERTFELGTIVTMSCHPWDSNAKNKTHQIPPNKTHPFHICLMSKPRSNPLQAQVEPDEPSQHNEPPIPGPSPSSEPPDGVPTHEPEPEVAPMQSTEEPFGPLVPPSPISFPLCDPENPTSFFPLVPSSPHSHNDPCEELTNLRPTLMIPRAIVYK
ncbi:hypothetical protein O181_061263 [Austropuccinia psidii MF-1]|uniref:Uncharacterized protein n=1 Tax=Austropuccinia psidii MF-1 TaxID=1389203 RepID=A0A9Q3EMG9_9BASI|nr:hypothetical protein [Austropuccinia psidii MF-1]